MCRDFLNNKCNRGSACKFIHDREKAIASIPTCRDYERGRCDRGRACKFLHGKYDEDRYRSDAADYSTSKQINLRTQKRSRSRSRSRSPKREQAPGTDYSYPFAQTDYATLRSYAQPATQNLNGVASQQQQQQNVNNSLNTNNMNAQSAAGALPRSDAAAVNESATAQTAKLNPAVATAAGLNSLSPTKTNYSNSPSEIGNTQPNQSEVSCAVVN